MAYILFAVICASVYMYLNESKVRSVSKVRRSQFEPVVFSQQTQSVTEIPDKNRVTDILQHDNGNFDNDLMISGEETNSKPSKVFEGVLEDYGFAPYNYIPNNKRSFYVRINGQTIWSVGIGDAIRNSTVRIGDSVVLTKHREKVVDFTRILGEKGEVIATERLKTPKRRGFWSIVLVDCHDQQHGIATSVTNQPLPSTPTCFNPKMDLNDLCIQEDDFRNDYDSYLHQLNDSYQQLH